MRNAWNSMKTNTIWGKTVNFLADSNYYLTTDKQFLRCKEYEQFWREINGNDSNTMVFNSIEEALDFVGKSGEKCDVLVTGSLHLVGGVLSLLEPTLND